MKSLYIHTQILLTLPVLVNFFKRGIKQRKLINSQTYIIIEIKKYQINLKTRICSCCNCSIVSKSHPVLFQNLLLKPLNGGGKMVHKFMSSLNSLTCSETIASPAKKMIIQFKINQQLKQIVTFIEFSRYFKTVEFLFSLRNYQYLN